MVDIVLYSVKCYQCELAQLGSDLCFSVTANTLVGRYVVLGFHSEVINSVRT